MKQILIFNILFIFVCANAFALRPRQIEKVRYLNKTLVETLENSDNSVNNSRNRMHFSEFRAGVGLTLSGKLGLLSWGGTKSIEFRYKKKKTKKSSSSKPQEIPVFRSSGRVNRQNYESLKITILNSSETRKHVRSLRRLERQLDQKVWPLIEAMGNINLQSIPNFYWRLFRIDITPSASGNIGGVKLGGSFRLRIEWSRPPGFRKNEYVTRPHWLGTLNQIIARNARELRGTPYHLHEWRVALGFGIDGDIGVAKLGSNVAVEVFFTRLPQNFMSKQSQYASANTVNYINEIPSTSGNRFQKRKLKRAARRALRVAKRILRRVERRENRRQRRLNRRVRRGRRVRRSLKNKRWYLDTLVSSYSIKGSGSLDLVKVGGKTSLAFLFKQRPKEIRPYTLVEKIDKGFRPSRIRYLTSLEVGFEVPFLASFSLVPNIELLYTPVK